MHGKVERAERAVRRAIELNGREWEFHFRLAIAMELKGDLESAVGALRTAIDLTKDDSMKKILQARVDGVHARFKEVTNH
jgi:Flp pilus assembly protein TadD